MKKIDKTSSLKEILANKKFTVDVYQREYRWGRKQIEQLIEDLTNGFLKYYENPQYNHLSPEEVADYGCYYMGCIIRTDDYAGREIIDGQQRLTSLSLLLIYIYNLLKSDNVKQEIETIIPSLIYSSHFEKKDFNIRVEDRKKCMENLFNNNTDFEPENESSRNLLERYKDIEDLFPEQLKDKSLIYFAYWLIEKVILLELVAPSEKEAHTIFITMNDRGLSLNSSEMLKAQIINEIPNSEKNEVNKVWQNLTGKIKSMAQSEQSGIVNTADVEFISMWLRGNYARTLREGKKDSEDKDYELLGEKFHTWVRANASKCMGLNSALAYKEFVTKEMKQMVDLYIKIKDYSKKLTTGFEKVFYNSNRDLNYQIMLMMSAVDKNDSQEIVNQKIKLVAEFVDIFASRKILNLRKANWNTNKVSLFKVMVNIRNQDVKTIAIILHKALESFSLNWDRFDYLEYDNQFFRRYALHFLARYTSYIYENMTYPNKFDEYVNRKVKNPYDIEHILPDSFDDYESLFKDEIEFKRNRQRLGNLILLTKDKNRSYQAMKYSEKREKYMGDNILAQALNEKSHQNNPHFIPLANKYNIKSYESIDKDVIEERHNSYLAISKDIWSFDNLSALVSGWTEEEYLKVNFETASKVSSLDKTLNGNTAWVIPANPKYYDVDGAFNEFKVIEWNQSANFEVNDIIYIYLSRPRMEIGYKCKVIEIGISEDKLTIDDSKYYLQDRKPHEKYMKLELLRKYDEDSLSFETMFESGVKTTFQGPVKASGVLAELLYKLDN